MTHIDRDQRCLPLPGNSLGETNCVPPYSWASIAVCDDAAAHFSEKAQDAIYSIGGNTGLFKQPVRSSYICIGTKGMKKGEAIELISNAELRYPMEVATPKPH
jgi:hypothetical protein